MNRTTPAIEVCGLTRDYGGGRGVFDLSFSVRKGEAFGFLGPNGAGKTTTIRQLLGFIRPDRGSASVYGLDCFRDARQTHRQIGYLPGEIALPEDETGLSFLRFMAGMKGLRDFARAEELMRFFDLDPSGPIRRMSKGMKQKVGIVAAFMADPELLILDEPTSGLDPLMQGRFVELVLAEKAKGRTILLSSHLFEEVERTCDRTAIIRQGRLVAVEEMDKLRQDRGSRWEITFSDGESAAAFAAGWPGSAQEGCRVTLTLTGEASPLIRALAPFPVRELTARGQTLEELFLHFYGGEAG